MGERAPYSRVYWSVVDDPKFADIYSDDRHLATWLRLLIAADAIWPASATLPVNGRKNSVQALVEAGLIDLLSNQRYRIHGLDAERGRRKTAATTREPNGDQEEPKRPPVSPSHAGAPRLVSSNSSARLGSDPSFGDQEEPEWPVLVWLSEHRATVTPNGGGLHQKVIRLVEKHGAQKVIAAMARLGDALEPGQYVLGVDNALNPIPRADVKEAREEETSAAFERRVERTRKETEEMRRHLEGNPA